MPPFNFFIERYLKKLREKFSAGTLQRFSIIWLKRHELKLMVVYRNEYALKFVNREYLSTYIYIKYKIKIFILLFFLLKNQIRKKIRIKIIIEIRVEIWFCRYEASFIQRNIIANSFNNIIDDLRNSKLFHSL